jgi:hypothetical protein
MTTTSIRRALCLFGLAGAALSLSACNDRATTIFVANGYPDRPVVKVWWNTTLIADPVAAGGASAVQRALPGDDFAYALLAPLVPARSARKLSVGRGDQLQIFVSRHLRRQLRCGHAAGRGQRAADRRANLPGRLRRRHLRPGQLPDDAGRCRRGGRPVDQ